MVRKTKSGQSECSNLEIFRSRKMNPKIGDGRIL